MPLIRESESIQQIVEPVVEAVLAPNFGNPSRIPNEDSQDFELQDTNLFGMHRLPGIDLVDEGPRINYGLNWMLFGNRSHVRLGLSSVRATASSRTTRSARARACRTRSRTSSRRSISFRCRGSM